MALEQASVQSGGGLRVKGRFGSGGLKVRSTRLHMIYPVSGPDARGVVSIEAKKKRGRHQFKLLAIVVPPFAIDGGDRDLAAGRGFV